MSRSAAAMPWRTARSEEMSAAALPDSTAATFATRDEAIISAMVARGDVRTRVVRSMLGELPFCGDLKALPALTFY